MTITVDRVGAHSKKKVYRIIGGDGRAVATFESALTAGIVLRFLNGGVLSDEDMLTARNALQLIDAGGDN